MTVRQPRYSKEETAQRGDEIYQSQIRPQLERSEYGNYVAIDIETGEFEVAQDTMTAAKNLIARNPDSQIWMVRVGYRAVHRFGARSLKDSR